MALGFFLIQDGFNKFGSLPDNLILRDAGRSAGQCRRQPCRSSWSSATLAVLSGATVFHSFAELNPGEAEQVLSGVAPGGHELLIGFEDLPSASGDDALPGRRRRRSPGRQRQRSSFRTC